MANPKQSKNDQILQAIHQLTGRIEKLEHQLGEPVKDSQPTEPERKEQHPKNKLIKLQRAFLALLRFPFRTPLSRFGAVIGLGIALVTGYVQLRYDVSVTPYSSLNPSDPGETRFLVTNQGAFPISNVIYLCKLVPRRTNNTDPFVAYGGWGIGSFQSLRPHGSFSAYCDYPKETPRPIREGTLLDLEITYTPKFLFGMKRRGGTLFILKFDKNGNTVWLPSGDMTPKFEDLEKLFCQTCTN